METNDGMIEWKGKKYFVTKEYTVTMLMLKDEDGVETPVPLIRVISDQMAAIKVGS